MTVCSTPPLRCLGTLQILFRGNILENNHILIVSDLNVHVCGETADMHVCLSTDAQKRPYPGHCPLLWSAGNGWSASLPFPSTFLFFFPSHSLHPPSRTLCPFAITVFSTLPLHFNSLLPGMIFYCVEVLVTSIWIPA